MQVTKAYSYNGIRQLKCYTCDHSYISRTCHHLDFRFTDISNISLPRTVTLLMLLIFYAVYTTMTLLHPTQKGPRMKSLQNLYIQTFNQWHKNVKEQSLKDKNLLFDLIFDLRHNHACTWPLSVTSPRHSNFSPVWTTSLHTPQPTFLVCIIWMQLDSTPHYSRSPHTISLHSLSQTYYCYSRMLDYHVQFFYALYLQLKTRNILKFYSL